MKEQIIIDQSLHSIDQSVDALQDRPNGCVPGDLSVEIISPKVVILTTPGF
jgi:hypothetical protein